MAHGCFLQGMQAPLKRGELPPPNASKAPLFPCGVFKLLAILASSIIVIVLLKWTTQQNRVNCMFQTTPVAAAAGPSNSLPALPGNPTYGTFLMYCEEYEGEHFWFGRTGNNIISLFSAALRAHSVGLDFKIVNCTHDLLDISHLSLDPGDVSHLDIQDTISAYNAYWNYRTSTGVFVLPVSSCCLKKSILPPLLRNISTSPSASKYHPDSLIIHIRSGDIYKNDWGPVHPKYGPPPLAFYTRAIEEHQSRHSSSGSSSGGGASIVIVTELENMSPFVDALLGMYPQDMITLQAGTLEEDVGVVLAARHLVAAQGSFAYALALTSEQLETLYIFKNNFNEQYDDRPFCDIDLVRYTAVLPDFLTNWTASSEQIEYLFEYPAENLTQTIIEGDRYYCNGVSYK